MAIWMSVSQGGHLSLVIFTQASIAGKPNEGSLHDPVPGLDAESPYARHAFHHLQIPATFSFAPLG